MTVLVYTTQQKKTRNEIKATIARTLNGKSRLKLVDSLEDLERWLLKPRFDEAASIVVLHLVDQAELEAMLNIKGLLRRFRLIIVLPKQDREAVVKAHTLHPRFLTYMDDNSYVVGEVLNNMLQKHATFREHKLNSSMSDHQQNLR